MGEVEIFFALKDTLQQMKILSQMTYIDYYMFDIYLFVYAYLRCELSRLVGDEQANKITVQVYREVFEL